MEKNLSYPERAKKCFTEGQGFIDGDDACTGQIGDFPAEAPIAPDWPDTYKAGSAREYVIVLIHELRWRAKRLYHQFAYPKGRDLRIVRRVVTDIKRLPSHE